MFYFWTTVIFLALLLSSDVTEIVMDMVFLKHQLKDCSVFTDLSCCFSVYSSMNRFFSRMLSVGFFCLFLLWTFDFIHLLCAGYVSYFVLPQLWS